MTGSTGPFQPIGGREHRLLVALVGLYPRPWRERYGDELRELLAMRAVSLFGVLALLRGAWDAHVHLPELVGDQRRPDARLRWSVMMTLTAWVAFCLSAAGVAKSTEDPAFTHAAVGHAALAVTRALATIAFVVAGLAVAGGTGGLGVSAVRQACRRRDGAAFVLLAVPVVTVAGVAGTGVLLGRLQPGPVHSPGTIGLAGGWLGLLLVAAIATVRAAGALLHRTDVRRGALRLAGWAAVVTAGAMTVGVAAGAAYGLAVWAQTPALFFSGNGLLSTALPITWAAALLVAVSAVAVGDRAVLRAVRAGR